MEIKEIGCGVCINSFRASGVKEGGYGLALIVNDFPCETAGVFTSNNLRAAPVTVTQEKIRKGRLQAVVVNSGNANACVRDGVVDAERMCELAGRELDIKPGNVGVASTGLIGRRLDMGLIEELMVKAVPGLSTDGSVDAARAILTTDTRDKQLSFEYKGIKVGGICKGSGMIAPNLATMLCFLTTNASLKGSELQDALGEAAEDSFNMLVVDDDMSTNDMVLLLSDDSVDCELSDFRFLLDYVTKEFAKLIAKDAEGATKFLEVELLGAADKNSARAGAKSIISSSLVKTAVYGENPNWGRIASALGEVTAFDSRRLDIFFESGGDRVMVVEKGKPGDLERAQKILGGKEIRITVNLNSGKEKAVAWGCDLTPEYVEINAGYS